MKNWPFDDAPNTACIVTSFVFNGSPILRVYHDFDGTWQFHGDASQSCDADAAKIVCLAEMIDGDPSLTELHDLPHGWRAYRSEIGKEWTRAKNHPYPTYEDDGFYLEDAEWLARFRDDINLPGEDARGSLGVGDYAKLVFRFYPEAAERQDHDCERMWVKVGGYDEDEEVYTGTLANHPQHTGSISFGEPLCFHATHIMAIQTDGDA